MLVTGASGILGPLLCERMQGLGLSVTSVSRKPGGFGTLVAADLEQPSQLVLDGRFDLLVHTAPLWLLPDNLECIAGALHGSGFASALAGDFQ